MAKKYVMQTSIHGRRLGISSSGGIISEPTGSTTASTGFRFAGQYGTGMQISHSSTAGSAISLETAGRNILSSATSTAVVATIRSNPELDLPMDIFILCTATAVTIDTNSTLVVFQSTTSSTSLTANSTLGAVGSGVMLVGGSTTVWFVRSKTGIIT